MISKKKKKGWREDRFSQETSEIILEEFPGESESIQRRGGNNRSTDKANAVLKGEEGRSCRQ